MNFGILVAWWWGMIWVVNWLEIVKEAISSKVTFGDSEIEVAVK